MRGLRPRNAPPTTCLLDLVPSSQKVPLRPDKTRQRSGLGRRPAFPTRIAPIGPFRRRRVHRGPLQESPPSGNPQSGQTGSQKRFESLFPAKGGPPRSESPSRGLVRLWELSVQGECCLEEEKVPESSKCGLRTAQRYQRQPPITTINSPSNFLSATASNREPTVPRCTCSCSFVKSFATAAGRSPYTASASARNAPSRCWLS